MNSEDICSANQWFHGLIDRRSSEQRLLSFGKPNCFLIRESRRELNEISGQKSYVLSFFGQNSGINHFRIQYICGQFYIGSKVFSSLKQLIFFYSNSSDLLRNERLFYPISPKNSQKIHSEKRLKAILPYNAFDEESDEISFKKGDVFTLHNDLQNGWLWVTNTRTQQSGLVFQELLESLSEETENNSLLWFHPNISKEEALELLSRAGIGSFLVRPSDRSPGNYSLFFHIENSVQRFRIERKNNRYLMGGRIFESLEEVINRYQNEQIVEGFKLEIPVLRQINQINTNCLQLREEKEDKDIYQTLRESREKNLEKKSEILFSGFLQKRSQKNWKKWKQMYFVLNSKSSHLYYYENERRTHRPKGIIDLNYSYVYSIHDSLFDKQFCFQVVERALPCLSTVYYLNSNDFDSQRQWISSILTLCPKQQQFLSENQEKENFRQMRSLFITLLEGSQLPIKFCSNPYLEIQFNCGVKVGRSQVKCPPDPIWEEEFVFEDIPLDVQSFSLVLYNKGKRQKDTEIAETTLELSKLNSNEEFEDWFHLNGIIGPNPLRLTDSWGSVRARIRFQSELILGFEEYFQLKQLLFEEDLEVIESCEHFCSHDRQPLALAVLKIARFHNKELLLIKALIQREIKTETQVQTLFRANSMTTSLIDQYLRGICLQFLRRGLQEPIQRVLESKISCELNPSRLDSPSEACHNAEHLLDVLDIFSESIFKSCEECPKQLSFICSNLQRSVQQKWPNDTLVRTRVVSGFVFLRLICPAILNPKQFSLINEIPSETAARTLILIAKSLQNLSNLVEFGTKSIFLSEDRFDFPQNNTKREPWMEIVNPFILKNKSKMIKFLDDISSQSDPNILPPIQWKTGVKQCYEEPTRELALIHSICELHKHDIQHIVNQNNSKTTLKKLLSVIEMLTKKKNRFQEMLSNNV